MKQRSLFILLLLSLSVVLRAQTPVEGQELPLASDEPLAQEVPSDPSIDQASGATMEPESSEIAVLQNDAMADVSAQPDTADPEVDILITAEDASTVSGEELIEALPADIEIVADEVDLVEVDEVADLPVDTPEDPSTEADDIATSGNDALLEDIATDPSLDAEGDSLAEDAIVAEPSEESEEGYVSVEPAPAPEDLTLELPESDVVLEMPGGKAQPTVSRDAETISVDFPDEEVRTIIRNVADLYDLNVVIPDTLVGSISLKLRNVTWRQVFNVALTPLGYTFVEEGNIIKIMSRENLQQEPVDTRVFIINFATAADLRSAIEPLITTESGGRIQVDVRSNALIITERPSRMSNIIEIIERLDRPTEQVMIESKFVEVTNSNLRDVGVNWSSLRGFGMEGRLGRSITDGSNRDSESTSQTQRGSSYSREPGSTSGQVTIINEDLVTDTVSRLDSLIREDTAVFSTDTFNMLVSALDQTDDIELISNPTVVTMNNTPAAIHIGEQYPVPQFTYNEERGTFEISGFETIDLGIKLNVLPQVNTAGFITMEIKPEISSQTDSVQFGGAVGTEIPIVTRRATESTVTIKSGYTLAIGGLVERTTSEIETKVPVLGDIPIMGRLFRHDSDTTDERNLIVFITAKVLNADGSTYRDVFSQRRLYEMGIKTRDLPGYEPPAEEKELFESLQETRDELEQLKAEAQLRAQLDALQKARMERAKEEAKKQSK